MKKVETEKAVEKGLIFFTIYVLSVEKLDRNKCALTSTSTHTQKWIPVWLRVLNVKSQTTRPLANTRISLWPRSGQDFLISTQKGLTIKDW